ncbi:MAG: rod shape-determining protein MreD [Sphingobacteriales bacterium]|jgi:rod shape-determining protein MreD
MPKQFIYNIFRFIGLVLLQILVMNKIGLRGMINPMIYVMFILLLPYRTSAWFVIILGFVLGITIDIFSDTPGLHTAATVLMAFSRSYVLGMITPRSGYDMQEEPKVKTNGIVWFVSYSGVLILIHHFALFYLEAFSWSEFFRTFLRAIFSGVFSLLLILIVELLRTNKSK